MRNKRIWFLIGVAFSIFVSGSITGKFLFGISKLNDDMYAIDYDSKAIQNTTDTDQISIPRYGTIQMPENTDVLKVVLTNPIDNPCFFKFTFLLDETGEVLYESQLVAPGKAIVEEKLNKVIEKGSHPLTIRIQSYELENREKENNESEVKTEIVTFTVDE